MAHMNVLTAKASFEDNDTMNSSIVRITGRRSARKAMKRFQELSDSDEDRFTAPKKAKKRKMRTDVDESVDLAKKSSPTEVRSSSVILEEESENSGEKMVPEESAKKYVNDFVDALGLSPMKKIDQELTKEDLVTCGDDSSITSELSMAFQDAASSTPVVLAPRLGFSTAKTDVVTGEQSFEHQNESIPQNASPNCTPKQKRKRGRPKKNVNLSTTLKADSITTNKNGANTKRFSISMPASENSSPSQQKESCGWPVVLLEAWEKQISEAEAVVCDQCVNEFQTLDEIKHHYTAVHGAGPRVTSTEDLTDRLVKDSYIRIEDEALMNYKNMETESRPLQCMHCGVPMSSLDLAVVHHLQCDMIESPMKCEQCSEQFFTPVGMRAHYVYGHTVWFDVESRKPQVTLMQVLKMVGSLKCQTCEATFPAVRPYKAHIATCSYDCLAIEKDDNEESVIDETEMDGKRRKRRVKYEEVDSGDSENEKKPHGKSHPDKSVRRYIPNPDLVKKRMEKDEWHKKLEEYFNSPPPPDAVPKEFINAYEKNKKKPMPCPKKCGRSLRSSTALLYHYPRCGVDAKNFEYSCKQCSVKYYYIMGMRQHVVRCNNLVDPFAVEPAPMSETNPDVKRQRKKVKYTDSVTELGSDDEAHEDHDDDGDEDFKLKAKKDESSNDSDDDDLQEMPVRFIGDRRFISSASENQTRTGRHLGSNWTYQRCKASRDERRNLTGSVTMRPKLDDFVPAEVSEVPVLPGCPPFRLESMHKKNAPEPVDVPNLGLFQSVSTIYADVVSTCYMNVGAPAFCAVWRTDPEPTATQYCIIHTLPDYETRFDGTNLVPHQGLFQIWDCGNLRASTTELEPKMVLGLVHDWGVVLDMRWNTFNIQCLESVNFRTLGYVLAACGDGIAKVFAVPEQLLGDSLLGNTYRERCYKVEPCAKLQLGVYTHSPCFSVDWCVLENRVLVAVGYRNGYVALFDLDSRSPLLVTMETRTWLPHKTFFTHPREVRKVRLSPTMPRVLVTCGFDQRLNFWYLDETTKGPVHSMSKGFAIDLEWSQVDCAIFFSVENFQRLSGVYTCTMDEPPPESSTSLNNRRLLACPCATYSMDHSDWLCNTVGATVEGDVAGHRMPYFKPMRLKHRECYWISRTLVRPKGSNEQDQERDELQREHLDDEQTDQSSPHKTKHERKLSHSSASSVEDIDEAPNAMKENYRRPHLPKSVKKHDELGQSYDLVFQDNHLAGTCLVKSMMHFKESQMSSEILDAYSAKRVFKVCWNPNQQSSPWLLVGRQCGLVSLHNLSAFTCAMARQDDA